MRPESFRPNPRPSLGVEIELQLVDDRTAALRGGFDDLFESLPPAARDSVKPEFMRCYAEVISGVCRDVPALARDLREKVRAVAQAARVNGLALAWGGTHPFSHWAEQEVTRDGRYLAILESLGETARRPVTFGLHVHVGLDSGDRAVKVMNGLTPYLPLLLAVSANSPFWCGRRTGDQAHRLALLEGFPTGGLPPRFSSWREYQDLLGRLSSGGFIRSSRDVYWDVRPSAAFGTVEVRVCDMPADLDTVLSLTALIQALVVDLAEAPETSTPNDGHESLFVRQCRWRAAKAGLGAELLDPRTGRRLPARDMLDELVARLLPTAESLGASSHLARLSPPAGYRNGAERQLSAYAETGDFREVARRMCGISLPVLEPAADDAPLHAPAPLGVRSLAPTF